MGMLAALAVGYVIGARAGSKDLDQVSASLRSLAASDEFADLLSALRSHLGHTLRELGGMIEGGGAQTTVSADDLVDQVRHLFGR